MELKGWHFLVLILIVGVIIWKLAPQTPVQSMWVGATGQTLEYCTADFNNEKLANPNGLYPSGCVLITDNIVACSNNCAGRYNGYVDSSYIGRWGYVFIQNKVTELDVMSAADKTSFGCVYTCVHNQQLPLCVEGKQNCNYISNTIQTITTCVSGQYVTTETCSHPNGVGPYCTQDTQSRQCCQTQDQINAHQLCSGGTACNTAADVPPCDGFVRKGELLTALQKYINLQLSKPDLVNALQAWINGGGI